MIILSPHPTSNVGSKLIDQLRDNHHIQLIHRLSKHHGLWVFYRGKHPLDQQQIPILQDFCKTHGLSLLPVTVDGTVSPLAPHSQHDTGQANALKLQFFPAILLVNPKRKTTITISYGFITQDVLIRRLIQAIQDNDLGKLR